PLDACAGSPPRPRGTVGARDERRERVRQIIFIPRPGGAALGIDQPTRINVHAETPRHTADPICFHMGSRSGSWGLIDNRNRLVQVCAQEIAPDAENDAIARQLVVAPDLAPEDPAAGMETGDIRPRNAGSDIRTCQPHLLATP